jgi:hypothetical protein
VSDAGFNSNSLALLAASDTYVYYEDQDNGELYSCPVTASECVPTDMNERGVWRGYAYGDSFFFESPSGSSVTLYKCQASGCGANPTALTGSFSAHLVPSPNAVDDGGVYWVATDDAGATDILTCPLSGCGSDAPHSVVATQSEIQYLRLSEGFVYWVEAAIVDGGWNYGIWRVAEPAL